MELKVTPTIKGIGVSPGIAIGKAHVIEKQKTVLTGQLLDNEDAIQIEMDKYDLAVSKSIEEVELLIAQADETVTAESLEILETHIEFLSDPQIRVDVLEKVSTERKIISDALIEVITKLVGMFQAMTDGYMRARAADVQDIGDRILKNLGLPVSASNHSIEPGSILIAEDISPSDTIAIDIKNVAGFATQTGGPTSHAAIVAKARGIPAAAGCGINLSHIRTGDLLILDGLTGEVILHPDHETLTLYISKKEDYLRKSTLMKALKNVPSSMVDGRPISLVANISEAADMDQVFENGGEGVGLLRSELLFMGRDSFPGEEEQFDFYKKVALKSQNKPVTIRTIDIGGDKQLHYFGLPQEQNPFLGYRAIRISLDRKDLFIVQLKAILRANVFGDLRIMFPMISNVQEIREAKKVLEAAKVELINEGTAFNPDIQVGIMIEIPSAAVMADILAKEVDFFSIGTNDLVQYTLAVDRMNEKVSALYDPFNPGVLRLISNVIEQGHKHNIHIAMCGELASDPLATLLLIGMGLKEFSMSAVSIPFIKNIIINSSFSEAREVYLKVNEMSDSDEIKAYLKTLLPI
ncbi:phosphoenolpyruvate--protein phosphotransferase [Dyadobacter pollutisoli]|uniref:Phosphoenolpyruvate-protein phosphotransferase n=1 Tax=Dyadobacter pollutisoli TaxID=2910158 RepID=A0A9E8NA02_9BACT|nr:phosphoenolpyruvate--protein phosphotransferase [Dyadobacter pollutisoli]WAC12650.1 phosphoenolpyruvate--protein phosphotransferase [Dyadobacter pollutisoli]